MYLTGCIRERIHISYIMHITCSQWKFGIIRLSNNDTLIVEHCNFSAISRFPLEESHNISHSANIRYKVCNFGFEWSTSKGTLSENQNTSHAASQFPSAKSAVKFLCDFSVTKTILPSRLYCGFRRGMFIAIHMKNLTQRRYFGCDRSLTIGHFTCRTFYLLACISASIEGIFLKI